MTNKKDNWTWGLFLFFGIVVFLFLSGFAEAILMQNYSVCIKIPVAIIMGFGLLYLYKRFLNLYDKTSIAAFGKNVGKLLIGWIVIAVTFSLIIGILYLAGTYVPQKVGFSLNDQLEGIAFFGIVAISEEIISRGIIYKLLCDKWNIWVGLIVSSLLFGFMHIFNEGATVWSALSIAITSGWLLAIAYSYYGTLWAPIGMHWAWNFLEGNVFGCLVSGTPVKGIPLITPILQGSDVLTGGKFGPESSIVTIIICAVVSSVYTIMYLRKTGRLKSNTVTGNIKVLRHDLNEI